MCISAVPERVSVVRVCGHTLRVKHAILVCPDYIYSLISFSVCACVRVRAHRVYLLSMHTSRLLLIIPEIMKRR